MVFIPTKNTDFCVINLFNTDTGENFGQLNDIEDINITSESKTDYAKDKYGNKLISFQHNPTYTMTFDPDESINTEELYKIFGVDKANAPDAYDIQYIKFVQARKHKKRRINKKWLKRYGYKQMIVDSKGWKIKSNTDGSVEFIK